MTSDESEALIDAVYFALRGQPEPQLVVVAHDQLLIECGRLQQLSRDNHAREGNDGRLAEQLSRAQPGTGTGQSAARVETIGRSDPSIRLNRV